MLKISRNQHNQKQSDRIISFRVEMARIEGAAATWAKTTIFLSVPSISRDNSRREILDYHVAEVRCHSCGGFASADDDVASSGITRLKIAPRIATSATILIY